MEELLIKLFEAIAGTELSVEGWKFLKSKLNLGAAQQESSQETSDQNTVFSRRQQFNLLANYFKQLGCTDPKFIDPEQLEIFFAGSDVIFDSKNYLKIIQAIQDLSSAAVNLRQEDSNIVNDIIRFTLGYYLRNGYDTQSTVRYLEELKQKALDPTQDEYVVSLLKGDFDVASLLTLLSGFGKVDSQTYQQLANIRQTAIKMLGPQSSELMQSQKLRNLMATENGQRILKSDNVYNLLYNTATLKEKMAIQELQILSNLSNSSLAKGMLDNPTIRGLVAFSFGWSQFVQNLGDKSIGEVMAKPQ